MAILNPSQIHAVLKEEKAAAAASAGAKVDPASLAALLEKHSLTPDDVLENLRSNMIAGDTGAIRQKAVDTALKLNGLLNSEGTQPDFRVIINIIDPQFAELNPILIPR